MALLSIVVPVYNVEKYINKCIDSILVQTFQDFQLILINDGSTDSSGIICDQYAESDKRIIVIHKENEGLSEARNVGIEISTGDYISFIDSDDWIEPDMYEVLINNMKKYSADIGVCGINKIEETTGELKSVFNKNRETVIDQEAAIAMLFSKNDIISVYAWNKVYKRHIFDTIRYPKGIIFEDVYRIVDILKECKKLYINTRRNMYNYLRRENSITRCQYNKNKLHSIIAAQRNCALIMEMYPQYINNAKYNLYIRCFELLDDIKRSKLNYLEEGKSAIDILLRDISFILKNKNISIKRKLFIIKVFIARLMCVKMF